MSKVAAAAFITILTAIPAAADIRINLRCTIDDYSPLGNYPVSTLRSWVPKTIHVDISDSNQVKILLSPTYNFPGEVKRENASKIAMEATREATDSYGRKAFMSYALEWFKTSGRLFVEISAQGYNPLGTAKGKCEAVGQ